MSFAFTIPVWVLWTFGLLIGVPLVIIILALAYIGAMFVYSFKDGIW